MSSQDVRELVQRRPFQALRFTLTDGRTYEVRHPDLIMVGLTSIIIGIPPANQPDGVYERAVHVSLLHIMQIEPLAAPAQPSTN